MTTYTDMHAAQQLDALYPGIRAELDRLRGEVHALSAALAAERARADAAEAKLAAVPVGELDRWFEHSDVFRDVRNGHYDQYQAISDREEIVNWLAQQSEVQP